MDLNYFLYIFNVEGKMLRNAFKHGDNLSKFSFGEVCRLWTCTFLEINKFPIILSYTYTCGVASPTKN